jgi:hypothetical protein
LNRHIRDRFDECALDGKSRTADFGESGGDFGAGTAKGIENLFPDELFRRRERITLQVGLAQISITDNGTKFTPSGLQAIFCRLQDDTSVLDFELRLEHVGAIRFFDP